MLKFTNNIEKENFQNNVEMWHTNVSVIEIETETGKKQKTWQITDRIGENLTVLPTQNENEYSICGFLQYGKVPFTLGIYSNGDKFEILRAIRNGRNIKSDKLLNSFRYIAKRVHCYIRRPLHEGVD